MSYSTDLLAQARTLARREPRRPKQASLRRAVSAAYYGLFHLLIQDAAAQMLRGGGVADLRIVLRRAFQHAVMKRAAKSFAGGTLPRLLAAAVGGPQISSDLRQAARAFVDLQEARHEADYDFARNFTRQETLDLIDAADQARQSWQSVRTSVEGRAFLTALLVYDRLSSR